MKKPSAIPRTCVESRFGPPRIAIVTPAPKPAIRMLVPLSTAIQASRNKTSRATLRSSAQRRCFERTRAWRTNPPWAIALPTKTSAAAVSATRNVPSTASPTRLGCSTIGTETIVKMSAIVVCAITRSATGPPTPASRKEGSSTAADPEASTTA